MTSLERKRSEMVARKAREVREVWLREREEQTKARLDANAAVKRSWAESDTSGARPTSVRQGDHPGDPTG